MLSNFVLYSRTFHINFILKETSTVINNHLDSDKRCV